MWWQAEVEKNPRGNRVFKTWVPVLPHFFSSSFHIWVFLSDLSLLLPAWSGPLFFFLSSSSSSSSFLPSWSVPLFFVPLSLCFLFLCSYPIWFVLVCFTIEIESCRLGFTFYKLKSIRLEIYVTKNTQISKWNSSIWNSIFRLKSSL